MLSFSLSFTLLNLILHFWGQQVLRLFKIRETDNTTSLTVVAGLVFLIFLSYVPFPFIRNYSFFLFIFYVLRLTGPLISLLLKIKLSLKNANIKKLLINLLNKDIFSVSIVLSLFLSFLFSAIWPSGRMGLWISYSVDFCTWIFLGEYLVGGINPEVLDLTPLFYRLVQDAFGTYAVIDFIAAANLKTPFLASSCAVVTMLLLCGTAVCCLLKKSFNLKPWLSLVLTLGLVSGSLFNCIGLVGMFGHLAAMTAYLAAALERIIPSDNPEWPFGQLKRRLFIPAFFIFLAYQAGYAMYSGLIILAGMLLAFLSHKNPPFIKRTVKATFEGVKQVILITTAISAILMPSVFSHIFSSSLEVVAQTSGWHMPFFSPWLFSGFPYYSPKALIPACYDQLTLSPLLYLPLAAAVIGLLISVVRPNKKRLVEQARKTTAQNRAILSLAVIFLNSLAAYLFLNNIFGHIYKVWKFAAYTILPLSFLPTTLFISALARIAGQKKQHLPTVAVMIAVLITGKTS
jgi:hypothetical protein